ncbi:MAG: hypothetical protein BWY57_01357 [Betaproteobacteria bacterium ADurb.Bin341]|nr:MAG: hypothetical protein BWY57_01357 [Betaproteobacteria bacterium ADurb.Bin341]
MAKSPAGNPVSLGTMAGPISLDTAMKRTRFGSRERISRDAAELQRLAIALSESGSKLEDGFLEAQLGSLVEKMLQNGAEDDLNTAFDHLFETNLRAHEELADMVETCVESTRLSANGKDFDILLFASPLLAWSRFSIPSGKLPTSAMEALNVQLGAHMFGKGAKVALADYLFSPDQLPRSYCDTWRLTNELGAAALSGKNMRVDASLMPETNPFLSDVRYLVGAIAIVPGHPPFRWNEADGSKETALKEWIRQGSPNLDPLLAGCAWQALLTDAYHTACRTADRESRPYSLKASIAFLQVLLGLMPADIRAVVGPFHDQKLEEYRIGLGPRNKEDVFHGIVWPLLGPEDENTETSEQIESLLHECGVKDILLLDHHFPMEYCDDCGAPLYPDANGELVHAEMPEQTSNHSQVLH